MHGCIVSLCPHAREPQHLLLIAGAGWRLWAGKAHRRRARDSERQFRHRCARPAAHRLHEATALLSWQHRHTCRACRARAVSAAPLAGCAWGRVWGHAKGNCAPALWPAVTHMPPELVSHSILSPATDAWSFGEQGPPWGWPQGSLLLCSRRRRCSPCLSVPAQLPAHGAACVGRSLLNGAPPCFHVPIRLAPAGVLLLEVWHGRRAWLGHPPFRVLNKVAAGACCGAASRDRPSSALQVLCVCQHGARCARCGLPGRGRSPALACRKCCTALGPG